MKKEAAKAKAKERERQQRLEARREQRKNRQEQAVLNAKLVEDAYRKSEFGPDCQVEQFELIVFGTHLLHDPNLPPRCKQK